MSQPTIRNVVDFGADSTGQSYSDSAFQAALQSIASVSPPTQNLGAALYVPAGLYRLQQTLRLNRPTLFYGDGMLASVLKFDEEIDGIVVESVFTSQDGGNGGWSTIRDLQIIGQYQWAYSSVNFQPPHSPMPILPQLPGPTDPSFDPLTTYPPNQGHPYLAGSAVVLFHRAFLERCWIGGFKYDGVHVQSDDIADNGQLQYNHKNANGWRVAGCRIESHGRHAIYLMGENANAGVSFANDIYGCGSWGIYDRSFLGNLHLGNQIAECRLGARYVPPGGVNVTTFLGEYSEADNTDSIGKGLWLGGIDQLPEQPACQAIVAAIRPGMYGIAVHSPVYQLPAKLFVRDPQYGDPNSFWVANADESMGLVSLDITAGNLVLVLPDPSQATDGWTLPIKIVANPNNHEVWIQTLNSKTIDGSTQLVMQRTYSAIIVRVDGDHYSVIGQVLGSATPG